MNHKCPICGLWHDKPIPKTPPSFRSIYEAAKWYENDALENGIDHSKIPYNVANYMISRGMFPYD